MERCIVVVVEDGVGREMELGSCCSDGYWRVGGSRSPWRDC